MSGLLDENFVESVFNANFEAAELKIGFTFDAVISSMSNDIMKNEVRGSLIYTINQDVDTDNKK